MPDLMRCREIKPGMLFDWRGEVWQVRNPLKYVMHEGEKLYVDNSRSNKWFAQRVGHPEETTEICFDIEFEKRRWNFRNP